MITTLKFVSVILLVFPGIYNVLIEPNVSFDAGEKWKYCSVAAGALIAFGTQLYLGATVFAFIFLITVGALMIGVAYIGA